MQAKPTFKEGLPTPTEVRSAIQEILLAANSREEAVQEIAKKLAEGPLKGMITTKPMVIFDRASQTRLAIIHATGDWTQEFTDSHILEVEAEVDEPDAVVLAN